MHSWTLSNKSTRLFFPLAPFLIQTHAHSVRGNKWNTCSGSGSDITCLVVKVQFLYPALNILLHSELPRLPAGTHTPFSKSQGRGEQEICDDLHILRTGLPSQPGVFWTSRSTTASHFLSLLCSLSLCTLLSHPYSPTASVYLSGFILSITLLSPFLLTTLFPHILLFLFCPVRSFIFSLFPWERDELHSCLQAVSPGSQWEERSVLLWIISSVTTNRKTGNCTFFARFVLIDWSNLPGV